MKALKASNSSSFDSASQSAFNSFFYDRNMKRGYHPFAAGIVAIFFYLIHAGVLVYGREPYHIIWSCHLGCLLIGIGLLLARPWFLSIGFFWLIMGVPLWILNVLTGADFMLTSTLSHIGGLVIAFYGLRFIEIPRFSWAGATIGLVVLGSVTRMVTPEHANVNLSFAVWTGWEQAFPSYFWYVVLILSTSAATFWVMECIVRKVTARREDKAPTRDS